MSVTVTRPPAPAMSDSHSAIEPPPAPISRQLHPVVSPVCRKDFSVAAS